MSGIFAVIESVKKEIHDKFFIGRKELEEKIKIKEVEIVQLKQEIVQLKQHNQEQGEIIIAKEGEIQKLNKEIRKLQSLLLNVIDPTDKNKKLPFNSKITYSFGGLAYKSDKYPGYVWRLGKWYQITPTLSFPGISNSDYREAIKNNNLNRDESYVLDDLFTPVIVNNARYFIKIRVVRDNVYANPPNANKYKLESYYIYDTETKNIRHIQGNSFPHGFHPDTLVFEEPNRTFQSIDAMYPNILSNAP